VGLLTWFFEDALNTRLQKKNAMRASSFARRPQGDAADHGRVGCFFTKKGLLGTTFMLCARTWTVD
jgi:hypothetical protein